MSEPDLFGAESEIERSLIKWYEKQAQHYQADSQRGDLHDPVAIRISLATNHEQRRN